VAVPRELVVNEEAEVSNVVRTVDGGWFAIARTDLDCAGSWAVNMREFPGVLL
jgi:hypothetical protein